MTMRILRKLFLLLFLIPGLLHATEEIVVLEDGSSVKAFLFYPENDGEGPWPLTVLMSGGTANEYIVRAQFWLGYELASRGWVIAVPVSPDDNSFFGSNGEKIPKVIEQLQKLPAIEDGKTLLVGVSNGGSSALEIASRNPEEYYGVVAVPGLIKDHAIIGKFDNLPIFLRIGENDFLHWNRQLPILQKQLTEAGARVDAKLVPDGSHVFTIDWNELQPWLDALR
jgi:predicted esterase